MSHERQPAGWTRADLERMPDGDGMRYELLGGELYVTATPAPVHQIAIMELASLLRDPARAEGLLVLPGPLDVVPSDGTVLRPDLVVIAPRDLGTYAASGTPAMVVEVLAPRSRATDLGQKRARYAEVGIPHYWVVDPAAPALTAFELRDAAYVEVARVEGDAAFAASAPVAVTVVPAALVAPFRGAGGGGGGGG